MPQYLVQSSYSSEALAALTNNPHDRFAVITKAVVKLGGKVVNGWLSFGEYDAVLIVDMPDNVAAAAFAIAIGAGGATKNFKTTPLLSIDEGIAAMKAAATVGYKPPSA